MSSYDFVYGSKVHIQCQAQINFQSWDKDSYKDNIKECQYLILIKKHPSFFEYWCKPRHVIKCIVKEPPKETLDDEILNRVGTKRNDILLERNRSMCWTKGKIKEDHRSGSRHGKQLIISNSSTFCAKDMGINFDPKKYTYSCS